MSKVQRIENALSAWNSSRGNAATVKALLEKGTFFLMDANDEPGMTTYVNSDIFAYVGVENSEIIFILVPDSLDNKAWSEMTNDELDAVKIKAFKADYQIDAVDFLNGATDGSDISVIEALKRHHRWQAMREDFLSEEVKHTDGLFELFEIPYGNVKSVLTNSDYDGLKFAFGLVPDTENVSYSGYFADLVAWSLPASGARVLSKPLNRSLPKPPY